MSKQKIVFVLVVLVCIILIFSVSFGFDFILGTFTFKKLSMNRPAKGDAIADLQFHTIITRITDKVIDRYYDNEMALEYSTVDIENCYGTRIILRGVGGRWYIYDVQTKKFMKVIRVRTDGTDSWVQGDLEPRWHSTNPNVFYYIMDRGQPKNYMALYSYDIRKDQKKIVRDFSKDFPWAKYIKTSTKGTPSADGRYWAFKVSTTDSDNCTDQTLFVYDIQEDKIISQLACRGSDTLARWISMTGSGKYVVVMWSKHPNISGGHGIQVYKSIDFSPINPSTQKGANSHLDIAIGTERHDGLFYQNTASDYIDWWNFETGVNIHLIKIPTPCCLGLHMSGNNYERPGWGLVSTYDPHRVWMDNQIFMIELKKNPRIWRLAHTRSVGSGYWSQAFATINKKGTKIYWSSNWDNVNQPLEVYQISLVENWYQILTGTSSTRPGF